MAPSSSPQNGAVVGEGDLTRQAGQVFERQQSLGVLADCVYALTAEGDPNVGAVEGVKAHGGILQN